MAVNFGILAPIQPQQQIIQTPQRPSSLDSLSGGIMQGLLQGQQIQATRQNMAATKQSMDQQAALFPGQQQIQQQTIEGNQLNLDQAKQQKLDADQLRAAAAKGEQVYLDAIGKINPSAQQDYLLKKAQVQNTLAEAFAKTATGKGTELDNHAKATNIIGQAAEGALMAKDPAQQQQIWAQSRSLLPPQMQKLVPQQFDQNFAMAATVLRYEGMADFASRSGKDDRTATQKDLQRIGALEQKEKLGRISDAEVTELTGLKNKQAAVERGNVLPENKVQDKLLDLDIKKVEKLSEDVMDTDNTLQQVKAFREANKQFPSGMFGATKLQIQQSVEALTGVKLANTKYGESLNKLGMDFVFDRIRDTKGSISEKEMEAFAKASAGMRNSQAGNDLILNMLETSEIRKREMASFMRDYLEKNKNLKGADKAWQEHASTNLQINPKTFKLIGAEQSPGQSNITKTLNGTTYIQKDGKWYQQ